MHYETENEFIEILKSMSQLDYPVQGDELKVTDLSEERVIFSGAATIVIDGNGKKTMVKCSKDDDYNPLLGYLICKFMQSTGMSHTQTGKYLDAVVYKNFCDISKEKTKKSPKDKIQKKYWETTCKELAGAGEINYEFTDEDYDDYYDT